MSVLKTIAHDTNGNPMDKYQQPVEIQGRRADTVQTHNAVSVALSGTSIQANWQDADGFDKVAVTLLNDASTASSAVIYWSNDGVSIHGNETIIASGTQQQKAGELSTKARYFKVVLVNGDATTAHTMSAWAYLKA